MEKVINNEILDYLLKNNLITEHQHGFIKKNLHVLIYWNV